MNRRRFLSSMAAAVAAVFVPAPAAEPIHIWSVDGFVPVEDYVREHEVVLMRGEIGRWENVRFIVSSEGGCARSL